MQIYDNQHNASNYNDRNIASLMLQHQEQTIQSQWQKIRPSFWIQDLKRKHITLVSAKVATRNKIKNVNELIVTWNVVCFGTGARFARSLIFGTRGGRLISDCSGSMYHIIWCKVHNLVQCTILIHIKTDTLNQCQNINNKECNHPFNSSNKINTLAFLLKFRPKKTKWT